ncbi:MAG: hypothetical protein Q4G60_13040, partial [bacterium]|nr:hypothetical protein [bacterium]
VGLLGACGKKADAAADVVAPFSEVGWDSSVEDVKNMEGNSPETYDSVYGGTTYSYSKEYLGRMGTIKYMFDDKDMLMNIAWAYGSDSEDELYTLYDEINQSVNDIHGESGYQADSNASNYGNVWYLESGDIILSTMVTADNKALQYAYLNPAVSNTEKQPETN